MNQTARFSGVVLAALAVGLLVVAGRVEEAKDSVSALIEVSGIEIESADVSAMTVVPTSTETSVHTTMATATPASTASSATVGTPLPIATPTIGPTATSGATPEVVVQTVGIAVPSIPTFTLADVLISTTTPVDTIKSTELVVCNELTGYCRNLEYQKPVSLSIACEDKRVMLREIRTASEKLGAMCSPEISIVSESKLAELRGIEENNFGPIEVVELGATLRRGGLVARVVSIERGPVPGYADCEVELDAYVCVNVGLEIINVGSGKWEFHDEDFLIPSFDPAILREAWRGVSRFSFGRPSYVLEGGERLLFSVPRPISRNGGERLLLHLGDFPMMFSLGEGQDWFDEETIDFGSPEFRAKEKLEYIAECGFEFMSINRSTKEIDARASLGDDVLHCDPNAVSVSSEDLNMLKRKSSSEFGSRWNPVPFGSTYKNSEQIFKVLAVRHHGVGDPCGEGEVPEDHICVAVEFEITNLNSESKIWYNTSDFKLIGSSGVAHGQGSTDPTVSPYGDGTIKVYPGKRLTTRIVRYVPINESSLTLIYADDRSKLAFRLDEEQSTDEVPYTLSSRLLIGSAGRNRDTAAPLGTAVFIDDFAVKILDVERGWIPDQGCCVDGLPEALLSQSFNDLINGIDRKTADHILSQSSETYTVYEGEMEYVRVSIEATNMKSLESSSLFNVSYFFLVDGEGNVYTSGFYTKPENQLISAVNSYRRHISDWWRLQPNREAEVYGGGKVVEELAWLVPKDALDLQMVYVPYLFEAGGFLSLDESDAPGELAEEIIPTWVEEAVAAEWTTPDEPAVPGTAVTYGDGVSMRIAAVERLPSPCNDSHTAIDGGECLNVTLEYSIAPSSYQRDWFIDGVVVFLIDGETIRPQRNHGGGLWFPAVPRFESLLDWIDVKQGRSIKVDYTAEVNAGWSEGMLVLRPYQPDKEGYLSLGTSRESKDEDHVKSGATLTTTADGIFEHLQRTDPKFLSGIESYLGEYAIACGTLAVRPYHDQASWVWSIANDLVDAGIEDAAPEYFPPEFNALETCTRAFPESSKFLVLSYLLGSTRFNCENRITGAFGASSNMAIRVGEVFFDFLDGDSPISFADFSDLSGLCEWFSEPIHGEFKEYVETAELSEVFSNELFDKAKFKAIIRQYLRRDLREHGHVSWYDR